MLGRVIWELGVNPTLRVKVICASDDLAKKRVRLLRRLIEHNECVKAVFPDLVPGNEGWTQHSFSVQRATHVVDSSVEAYGVTSRATGGRSDLLIFDDVCDLNNSLLSNVRRQEVIDLIDNVWINLVHPSYGRIWFVGTPWHYQDALMKKSETPGYAFLKCGIDAKLTPIWPERWPTEKLQQRKADIGSLAFARSFHCWPQSGEEQLFKVEWFQFWRELPEGMATYIGVDPAFSDKAKADSSAIVVIGVHDNTYYVLEAIARQGLSQEQLIKSILSLCERYQPQQVGVETVQAQVWLAQQLVSRGRWAVKQLRTVKDKYSRMSVLATHFENGRIHLRANGNGAHKSQEQLYDQLVQFGAADHDDLCDALDFAVQAACTSRVELLV